MKKAILFLLFIAAVNHSAWSQGQEDVINAMLLKIYAAAPDQFASMRGIEDDIMEHWYHTTDTLPGTVYSSIYVFDSSHAFYNTYFIRNTDKATALSLLDAWKKRVTELFPELKGSAAATGNKWIFSPVHPGTGPQPGIVVSASVQPGVDTNWCMQLFINYGIE